MSHSVSIAHGTRHMHTRHTAHGTRHTAHAHAHGCQYSILNELRLQDLPRWMGFAFGAAIHVRDCQAAKIIILRAEKNYNYYLRV